MTESAVSRAVNWARTLSTAAGDSPSGIRRALLPVASSEPVRGGQGESDRRESSGRVRPLRARADRGLLSAAPPGRPVSRG
ncbi:hypothetical protein GCM10010255_05480 [Streptomyces coeruleofuscus]|uniref:Uncharacterized protein n=1 Tax=Streptomyces coeruleofuscus TaxID=66879 RepID=A0ABP5UNV5_9ACTN